MLRHPVLIAGAAAAKKPVIKSEPAVKGERSVEKVLEKTVSKKKRVLYKVCT